MVSKNFTESEKDKDKNSSQISDTLFSDIFSDSYQGLRLFT